MKRIISLATLVFCINFSAKSQQLYINEFMASNHQTIADGTGAYEDWFEVYNPNSYAVNLGGYYVTDNLGNPTKYQLPTGTSQTIIPANGFLILWASGVTSRGANHTSFNLSAGGEQIGLYRMVNNILEVVDSLSFGSQRTDISQGRKPDGSNTWLYFQASTNNTSPGGSNNSKTGYSAIMAAPAFSQSGGFYTSALSLTLSASDPGATIYYTLDGSDPDPSNLSGSTFQYKNSFPENPGQSFGSLLTGSYQTLTYTAPISVTARTSDPNKLSVKSSTAEYSPAYFPVSSVYKGTVIRALVYKANTLPSEIITQSYFVSPDASSRYGIPVVSIATNEKNFFDYTTGFYTAGKAFDDWRTANPNESSSFCTVGNFSNDDDTWERSGNAEFFVNNSSIINQLIGVRINGNCTRAVLRKSLRLYASSEFSYPFFANRPSNQSYNRLILRNGGNDWWYSLLIDAFTQTMVRHLRFDTQSNRPGIVFVNGEYWGLHTLLERYDKYYISQQYGIDTDSVDMVSVGFNDNLRVYGPEVVEGNLTKYNALLAYFNSTNPVSLSYVNTQIDIDNFTDYHIAELFAANTDWPQNNQLLWRKQTSQYLPNAPYGADGRFRWMLKDMDFGMSCYNSYTHNTLNYAMQSIIEGSGNYTLIFRRLLALPDFKAAFINRYADLLNTTYLPTRTTSLLSSFQQEYQPYIQEHVDRWHNGTTYSGWLTNIGSIQTYLQQRPSYARDHLRTQFSLTANRSLTVNVSDTVRGYVRVNTIDIRPTTVGVATAPYPWTGIYFEGNPIRIVAKAKAGFKFVSWQEANTTVSTDTAYSFNPTANRSLTAVFDLDDSFNSFPVSFSLASCDYQFNNWPATSSAGNYPDNMLFVSMNQEDPLLTAIISNTVTGAYNFTSRTRINGRGNDGFSFINTGNTNTNPGYVASTLGGALLAIRTSGLNEAYIQWTGGTVTPNVKQYRIRLRYRLGDSGAFTDLLDSQNNPVEYVRSATAGHSQVIGPVALPASILNKPYVQLLWQYYWTGVGTNARDELRVDDIIITRGSCISLSSASWSTPGTWSCGRVPTICDVVKINDGHTVTVSIPNATAKRIEFGTNARLQYTTATASVQIGN